jgi:hypothetical protein
MTITHTSLKLAFPEQRLIVTYEDQPLNPTALQSIADGWVHRCVPRSFARASPDDVSRHVFELLRERVLELGQVDLDEE